MTRTCDICPSPHYGLGLCAKHYRRQLRHGDPLYELVTPTGCSIDGCGEPFSARGWCKSHYSSWRAYGDPLKATRRDLRPDGYNAVHLRLKRRRGRASGYPCIDCGEPAQEWSCSGEKNAVDKETGKTYSTDLAAYDRRCRKCHRSLDAPRKHTGTSSRTR